MSSLLDFFRALARFDVCEYERRADTVGRAQLARDPAVVAEVRGLAEAAERARTAARGTHDRRLSTVLDVAHLFFGAQDYILRHDKPRYDPYAGVPLLQYLLTVDRVRSLAATQHQIWFLFGQILDAQISHESNALSAAGPGGKVQFEPELCRARMTALQAIGSFIPNRMQLDAPAPLERSSRFDFIARDLTGASAARRLLTFPQTTCHDEVAFLRFIQLTECLFEGTLLFVQHGLSAFAVGQLDAAQRFVRSATEFAAPLVKIFQAVKIMPPHHFLGFREATGEASAVQSRSWQLLDAHMYGVLPEKMPALAEHPEVSCVLRFARPTFLPLVNVVGEIGRQGVDGQLRQAIIELDQCLRGWRKFHEKQLAGRRDPPYLPPQALGTGGTSGHGYLAAQRPPRASRVPPR